MKQFFSKYRVLLVTCLIFILQTANLIWCITCPKIGIWCTLFAGCAEIYILLWIIDLCCIMFWKDINLHTYLLRFIWIICFIPLFLLLTGIFFIFIVTYPITVAIYYMRDGNLNEIPTVDDYANFCSYICSTLNPE